MKLNMKRFAATVLVLGLISLPLATEAQAAKITSKSFLSDIISGFQSTNAACASCFTSSFGGFTVTNAAAAPLGGFTNLNSWSYTANIAQATNDVIVTWTNQNGSWVIPTNATTVGVITNLGPGTAQSIVFVPGPDTTQLVKDIDISNLPGNALPFLVLTNGAINQATITPDTTTISSYTMTARIWGAASAANTLNFIFTGLPDGVNEATGAATVGPTWQWGVTPASGVTVVVTNVPMWRFAGCSKIRLKSATLTTTTAANIGVTVQALNLSGPGI